jgi:hypothetical protein
MCSAERVREDALPVDTVAIHCRDLHIDALILRADAGVSYSQHLSDTPPPEGWSIWTAVCRSRKSRMQASSARPNGTSAVCVLRHSCSRATNCRSSDVFTVSRVRGVLMRRRCHVRKIMSTALRKYVDMAKGAAYIWINKTGDSDMTLATARRKLHQEEKKMEAGKPNNYRKALQEFNDKLRETGH